MKNNFETFENIYWVSGEDKHYEVLAGVVWDDLGNGLYEILCNNTVYEVPAHRIFKPESKEDAIEFANDLIRLTISNHRTWIVDPNLVSHKEYFESVVAELQLVQEKNNRL